jgi:hypothetical protein
VSPAVCPGGYLLSLVFGLYAPGVAGRLGWVVNLLWPKIIVPQITPIPQMIAAVSAEPLRIMSRAVKVTCRFVQLEPAI